MVKDGGDIMDEGLEVDRFYIYLTIDGTSYEGVEVTIPEPYKSIREQIADIVAIFNISEFDSCGYSVQYLLGKIMDDGEEPEILEFEDENGREQALIDFNIQSGDHLHLIQIPVSGSIWCNMLIVKPFLIKPFEFHSLEIYKVGINSSITNDICRLSGWIDNIITELVSRFNLTRDRQYYLAKLCLDSQSKLRFYFLNGEEGSANWRKSIFNYAEELKPEDSEYPDLLLFPSFGISKRIMRQIDKYYNRIPRFLTI